MSVGVSVALSNRVGGFKKKKKKSKRKQKTKKTEEINSLHFRARSAFDGLGWQILARP